MRTTQWTGNKGNYIEHITQTGSLKLIQTVLTVSLAKIYYAFTRIYIEFDGKYDPGACGQDKVVG